MNLLTCHLPDTVEIGGKPVSIHTDFRVWANFESLVLAENSTVEQLLALCYQEPVMDPVEAVKKAVWFYRMGKEDVSADTRSSANKGRCYDFEQDSASLVASFRAAYGIDLLTEEIHWWAFRALMLDLPEDCPFCKIVGYRTVDTKGMDPKRRKFYTEQKKRYALKQAGCAEPTTLRERDQNMRDYIARRFRETEANRGKKT